ncbi:MAG: hypothetical protein R2849_23230 [Thermomicrobiales bacterium]
MADFQQELLGWFAGRIPDDWFLELPEVSFDREEILIVGVLSEPRILADASDELRNAALRSKIDRFRDETRDRRTRIADEAQQLFGRQVSWGVNCGGYRKLFTNLSVPVMTRLRMPERQTLDTLIDSGVARSRSDALAWCVRLVARHQSEWLDDLRDALTRVEQVRSEGPNPDYE